MQQLQIRQENSLDLLLELMLTKFGIKSQAFDGGSMNGACTTRLLNNLQEIMDELQQIALQRYNAGGGSNDDTARGDRQEKITNMFLEYSNLFLVLDLVFSLLCTIAPTANEIAEAERSLKVLQTLWLNLGFNIAPKAHILFYHTLEQFKNYDGIADKVEDFVESASAG